MKKIVAFTIIVILVTLVWLRVNSNTQMAAGGTAKLTISTSFYPLYYFASEIAGPRAKVINLTPAGVEPHDYELTPADVQQLEASNIVFINGNLEPWSGKINTKRLVTVSEGLQDNKDPHVWLDPLLAIKEVNIMTDELVAADPEYAQQYRDHAAVLVAKLDMLDTKFRDDLRKCTQRTLVTSHKAWGYLTARYGLRQVAIAGLDPEQEPAAKDLAVIIKAVRDNNVSAIYFESLTSPKLVDTVARETGAKTLELNPLEGLTPEQVQAGDNYFSIQQHNLNNLIVGLSCQ